MLVPVEKSVVRLLVADDSASDVYMFEHALGVAGLECSLVHVEDGDQALAALRETEGSEEGFNLVLLDWYLPKKWGGEILPIIQGMPGAPSCVVLTSGLPQHEIQRLATQEIAVWVKPADLDGYLELGRCVKEMILEQHANSDR